MPELSRFHGIIIIRMFLEVESKHNKPHFHAYYQEYSAVIEIENSEIIAGFLPKKESKLVLA